MIGLHKLSDEEYFASDATSCSDLKPMAISPAHYKQNLNNPQEPTEAMRFGSLFHTMNLEPERLAQDYAIAPEGDKRKKDVKEAWNKFLDENAGKIAVTKSDWNLAEQMTEAIAANETATELLSCDGINEQCIFSEDPDTGIAKRGKIDRIITGRCLVDLKSTQDASPNFIKSVINFDYHMQAAYYLDLCEEQGIEAHEFIFVCVEKAPPFGVGVYKLEPELVDRGRKKYKRLLNKLKECRRINEFPCYYDEVVLLRTPNWMEGE